MENANLKKHNVNPPLMLPKIAWSFGLEWDEGDGEENEGIPSEWRGDEGRSALTYL